MEVIEGTEKQLTEIFAKHTSVIIKYHTDSECEDCVKLLPVYAAISKEDRYKDIKFIRLNSDNNKVAEALINQKKVPFIAIYRNSFLIECDTVTSEAELRTMLEKLIAINLNNQN